MQKLSFKLTTIMYFMYMYYMLIYANSSCSCCCFFFVNVFKCCFDFLKHSNVVLQYVVICAIIICIEQSSE